MPKKNKVISDFVELSEFNVISNAKEIVKLSLMFHQDVLKQVEEYIKYMESQNYHKSRFMEAIEESCKQYIEDIKKFSTKKDKQAELDLSDSWKREAVPPLLNSDMSEPSRFLPDIEGDQNE
jgi:hypothetical protein